MTNSYKDGNKTEWSPVRSVIARLLNRIRGPCSESATNFITGIGIKDRIARRN